MSHDEELAAVIAELQETQAKLLGAQKLEAIGQLAAGIAHEINTPAQYVSDNVNFLRRAFCGLADSLAAYGLLEDAVRSGQAAADVLDRVEETRRRVKLDYLLREAPRALEQSLEGLARVTSIVGAMKDFSYPSQGKKVPTDLRDLVQTTLMVARNEWKYVAEVELVFDAELPPVACLRDEMNQVLLNLIVNAAHAIGEATRDGADGKGSIRIGTRRSDRFAEITVTDTGAGIPERLRPRIFEPLFTTKAVGRGTGQGLAIARSIVVDKHRGEIDFESVEGRGTTFYVRLPMGKTAEQLAP